MAADSNGYLKMSLDDGMNPEAKEILLNPLADAVGFREMWPLERTEDDTFFGYLYSRWVTLSEGEYYYFETAMWNRCCTGHLTIAMEVKPDEMPTDHPLLETQVQRISLSQSDILFDTMQITVQNPDGGLFILMFLHPTTAEFITSLEITSGADAYTFQHAIKTYYKAVHGIEPTVALTFYNDDIEETVEGADDVTTLVYTIEVPRTIS